jgi:hypothetical protein
MTGVSLPEWTRCLVEKEDSIDASWKGASSSCRLGGLLEQTAAADALQPTLRSGFRARLSASVRCS